MRLIKLCSELNIGIRTAVDFLLQKGQAGDWGPMSLLSDNQHTLLLNYFGAGTRIPLLAWKDDRFSFNPKANRRFINLNGWNRLRVDTLMRLPSRYVLIPKDQSVERWAFWSNVDFESKCAHAVVGCKIIKDRLVQPSGYLPVAPDGITERVSQDANGRSMAAGRSIDLDALNASLRPRKVNTGDRVRNAVGEPKKDAFKDASPSEHKADQQVIRDIWQHFVEIQEQLIKQRCAPISILPEHTVVENDKLHVTIDESFNMRQLDALLKDQLGLASYDLESGYLLVEESKWNALSENELDQIRRGLAACYVELDTTPTIDVTIPYGGSIDRTDYLSMEELYQMDAVLKRGDLIGGTIAETAAFISKVSLDIEGYMRYLFGDHLIIYQKKQNNRKEPLQIDNLEYHNQYIPWEVMQQYAHIGLHCKYYTLIFKIKNPMANRLLREEFDCYVLQSDTFEFRRAFTSDNPCHKHYVTEVNEHIRTFMNVATAYCSKDDVETEVLFVYSLSRYQMAKARLVEVGQMVRQKGVGYKFNDETGTIGIDFNWRTDSIDQLVAELEYEIPYLKVNVRDAHRYKCTVQAKWVGYDVLKQSLEEKYEDIDIQNDGVYQQIRIRLPYLEPAFYEPKRANLQSDLLPLTAAGFHAKFAEQVPGKVRLRAIANPQSRLEDFEDAISAMRKADFGFMVGERLVPFGKLCRAHYPDLVFDLDVPEDKKDQLIEAFQSKTISTIIPILTGDLEKISRLKNTFTMATTGEELVNPRLQRFIFDSSEATITKDIDLLLNRDGTVYKELCDHLLNVKVNDSQIDAIIKALYAEDLAVIQGPPGTGKSTAIAELIWQLIRKGFQQGNKKERILLTSETNLAVDNAIARVINNKTNLVKPVRFGDEEKLESEGLQFSIELMKRWVEEGDTCLLETEEDEETDTLTSYNLILKNWLDNISSRSFMGQGSADNDVSERWRNLLQHPSKAIREIMYNRYMENVNVIGATCSSIGDRRAGNGDFNGFTSFFRSYCDVFKQRIGRARIEFSTVIQDESSKATPAELVLPFVYGHKAIVIGDHRQLPPMLDKEEFEDTLEYAQKMAIGNAERKAVRKLSEFVQEHFDEMEVSHFENLYKHIDGSLKGTFHLQYRMHPDINAVIEQFYRADGGLYCGLVRPIDQGVDDPDMQNPASRYHGIEIPGLINQHTHVLLIDTDSPELKEGTSRINYGEVDTIDKLLTTFERSDSFRRYLTHFSKEEDKQIGIISFYGKQIKQLRAMARCHPSLPTRVSTVDRFQGMERNIVIVSMVRSNKIQGAKNQQPDWKRYPDLGYPLQQSLGFAESPNRLNVALSRAKRLLIIVGNRSLFSTHEIYQNVFRTIEANHHNKVVKQQEVCVC